VRPALAAALALAVAACGRERAEAERAIRAYDEAAIEAYRTGDAAKVKERSTEREWRKVVALVDLKRESRLVLESELQALEVTGVERRDDSRLVARTRERWRYHDRPLDPGRPVGTTFVADMELEYALAREGGAWRVDAVRTLSSSYLEPKGYRPGAAPHGGGAGHDSR
jgi:hypothetical protein